MSLKPQLVLDKETGKICMQIRLGQFTATKPLPDEMATWTMAQLQDYFDKCVPEMVEHLHEMRRTDQRKIRKEAKRATDS